MVLRTLLIPKGQKGVEKGEGLVNTSRRREKRGKTRQHKSRKGEERKSSRQLNETLWCVFN